MGLPAIAIGDATFDHVITVDYETYYDTDYSLKKLTTAEYILSGLFETIGVSVKVDEHPAEWFSGPEREYPEWLARFPWARSLGVAQNAIFDGGILEWRHKLAPVQWYCTLMAGNATCGPFIGRAGLAAQCSFYGLPAKGDWVVKAKGKRRWQFSPEELAAYGRYCVNDAERTYDLYKMHINQFPPGEISQIHETVRKFVKPQLRLDPTMLHQRLEEVEVEKATVLMACGVDDATLLRSNNKFAEVLEELGVTPPTKISPTTGKETYAFAKTDPGMVELLNHEDSRVQCVAAARVKHKSTLEESRLRRFIAQQLISPNAFSVPLMYYAAHTGRLGGWDSLNLQNLPRGGALRAAIIPPPHYQICAGDLSQIEARIVAVLAGQWDLVEAFRKGEDVYRNFAAVLYGKPPDLITDDERFVGKTCILGLGYGMGHEKFLATMKVKGISMTVQEAKRIVWKYRETYPMIPQFWSRMDRMLDHMAAGQEDSVGPIRTKWGAIILPNGMPIFYPNLHVTREGMQYRYKGRMDKSIWGGALTENIVQALARIIISRAELYLAERGWHAALQVHDELVYVVRTVLIEKFKKVLSAVLTRPVYWLPGLPIACEVNIGDTYRECK